MRKQLTAEQDDAIEWLRDCGWYGWLRNVATGEIHDHHGQKWKNASVLVAWLQKLPVWPRATRRNIPRR